MNNNEGKRRMSPQEKEAYYLNLHNENVKLAKMREEAVKEVDKLREKVKIQAETNLKLNDALIDQSIKTYDSNARSEKFNDSMKEWIKLHNLKAKENIELKAKLHTLEAQRIDNQKEIEWQREQKNRLREKLEDLRKNPTSILRNCMVWNKDGVKRYNENGLISVGMSIDGNLTMDYSTLPINSIGALKSGKQPETKYVYAILPYPNHKDIILYRNLDKALEVLKNIGAAKGHNVIMYPLEIEE